MNDIQKKLFEIFPDQAKGKEKENRKTKRAKAKEAPKPAEEPKKAESVSQKEVAPDVANNKELTTKSNPEPIGEANSKEDKKE